MCWTLNFRNSELLLQKIGKYTLFFFFVLIYFFTRFLFFFSPFLKEGGKDLRGDSFLFHLFFVVLYCLYCDFLLLAGLSYFLSSWKR